MDNDVILKILPILALILLGFLVLAIVAGVGASRHFRRKKLEGELYPQVAASASWNYSLRVFPAVKGAIDYIDGKMFPNVNMFGSPAEHIMSGNRGSTSFAIFNYSYSLGSRHGGSTMSDAAPRMMYERCALIITRDPSIPEFAIEQKNEIVRAFNSALGDPSEVFRNQFKLIGNEGFLAKMITPQVQAFMLSRGIIRAYGNRNFLCVFYQRNENEIPELVRLQSQIDAIFGYSEMLGMIHSAK